MIDPSKFHDNYLRAERELAGLKPRRSAFETGLMSGAYGMLALIVAFASVRIAPALVAQLLGIAAAFAVGYHDSRLEWKRYLRAYHLILDENEDSTNA